MREIGLGHNSGAFKKPETKKHKVIVQLSEAEPTIIGIPACELKRRRQELALAMVIEGKQTRKAEASGPFGFRVNDRHKRLDVWGRSRAHLGTADDLTTAAGDDDLANHLYMADEPYLRADGMAGYLSDDEPEPDESAKVSYFNIDVDEGPDAGDEPQTPVNPTDPIGVIYSTASALHKLNLKVARQRNGRKR
jgi:hypothetical protein